MAEKGKKTVTAAGTDEEKKPAAKAKATPKKAAARKAVAKKPAAKAKATPKKVAPKKAVAKKPAAKAKATPKKVAPKKAVAKKPAAKAKATPKKAAPKKAVAKKAAAKAKAAPKKAAPVEIAPKKPPARKVLKPTWRTLDDPDVKEGIEDAEGDMEDAAELARRSGGASMSAWHAGQAAEKFLRTLAAAADLQVSATWDLRRVFEVVGKLKGASEMEAMVAVITGPGKGSDPPGPANQHHRAIAAATRIKALVTWLLGGPVPGEETRVPEPVRHAPRPPAGKKSGRGPGGPRNRRPRPGPGRSDRDRRSSFVKMFLMCHNCGVRIPRTRQTARGRVPCPLCNRPMKLVR